MITTSTRGATPTVVIAGAGFAGLSAARTLAKVPVRTVLVDQHNYHTFNPLLYQVAASMLDLSDVARPTRGLLQGIKNAEFRLATVTGVDFAGRWLKTDQGPLPYDYLILALGSTTNFFGNQGAMALSLGVKDLQEAIEVRSRFLSRFEQAEFVVDPQERRKLLSFVIIGGGPTGVETAGALSELVDFNLRRDFKGRAVNEVSITLLEGSPNVLGPFAPKLRDSARAELVRRGVEVRTGTHVKEVRPGEVVLEDGTVLPAGTVIWAAGVKAVEISGIPKEAIGRQQTVQVLPTLQMAGHPEVFVVGDMAGIKAGERQLPMLAQVAMQSAKAAAGNIEATLAGRPLREFKYFDKGIMATIGRFSAVVQVGKTTMTGFPAWVAWLFLHLAYLSGFRSKLSTLVDWSFDYLLRERPTRVILTLNHAQPAPAPAPPASAPAPASAPPAPAAVQQHN